MRGMTSGRMRLVVWLKSFFSDSDTSPLESDNANARQANGERKERRF
jgi:hypothetical protein